MNMVVSMMTLKNVYTIHLAAKVSHTSNSCCNSSKNRYNQIITILTCIKKTITKKIKYFFHYYFLSTLITK